MGSDSVSSLKISMRLARYGKRTKMLDLIDLIKKNNGKRYLPKTLHKISTSYKPTATETSPATPGGRLPACWANAPGFCSHSLPSTQILDAKN